MTTTAGIALPDVDARAAGFAEGVKAVRDALVEVSRRVRLDADAAKDRFVAPYSGNDAATGFHTARGVQQGVGMALDRIDAGIHPGAGVDAAV